MFCAACYGPNLKRIVVRLTKSRANSKNFILRFKLATKTWNNMEETNVEMHSVMIVVTGILLAFVLYPDDTNASILSGIDEPTGNAYEDTYIAEEENATFTSGSNQTGNDNNTGTQR
jgi:hypothetical protein